MEFTAEQQAHVNSLLAEATKNLYTDEDLNRKVTSEVDRRVESGIQKGLETQRSKWEDDYQAKAKLSAEEVAKLELKEQIDGLAQREADINRRSNLIDAKDLMNSAGIAQSDYSKFMDLLVTDDVEGTTVNVNNFIETFASTKKNIESTVRKELSNVPAPKGNPDEASTSGSVDFITMAKNANIRHN